MSFPDYEAAAKAKWLRNALSPWGAANPVVLARMVGEARLDVDAALGDETLYRIDTDESLREALISTGMLVQIYPKEDNE